MLHCSTSACCRREAAALQQVSTTIVTTYVSSYYNMCPRTTPNVSSYCYKFVQQQALVLQAGAGAVLILTRLLEAEGLQTRTMGRKRGLRG